MLIGLISDTHIRIPGYRANLSQLWTSELPVQVKEAFRGVDLILHIGDVYAIPILDELETVAPVLACEGDDDPFDIMNDSRVKQKHILNLGGVTIWLAHEIETWSVDGHENPPDVIIFGHTHQAALEKNNGIIRINPGSPTFPAYRNELGSLGLLKIESGKADAKIIQLQGNLGGITGSGRLQR